MKKEQGIERSKGGIVKGARSIDAPMRGPIMNSELTMICCILKITKKSD